MPTGRMRATLKVAVVHAATNTATQRPPMAADAPTGIT